MFFFTLRSYCKFCVLCDSEVNSPRCYWTWTLRDTQDIHAICVVYRMTFHGCTGLFFFFSPPFAPWPKWSWDIKCCTRLCRALKKMEILLLWRLYENFSIRQLASLFSQKIIGKSLSPTYFLSSAHWYSAVCLVLRDNVKAGNSAKWASVVLSLRLRVRLRKP